MTRVDYNTVLCVFFLRFLLIISNVKLKSVITLIAIFIIRPQEGVKREVLEETGLEMEPTTLLGVECASKAWFRFVMTGNVVGGRLKTPADADSESLQAKWIKNITEVNLRAHDIYPIIERGVAYHQYLKTLQNAPASSPIWHPNVLPVVREHKKLLLRLVVCVKQKSR